MTSVLLSSVLLLFKGLACLIYFSGVFFFSLLYRLVNYNFLGDT